MKPPTYAQQCAAMCADNNQELDQLKAERTEMLATLESKLKAEKAELIAALEALLLPGEYIDLMQGMTIEQLFPNRFNQARSILAKVKP